MAEPNFYVVMSGAFIGGCIGGLAAYLVQRWRYNIDRWTDITDELCKEIIAAADLSAEFWLKARHSQNKDEMALMTLKVKGSFARIDALKAPFEDWCSTEAYKKISQAYGELIDGATGGQFTAAKRDANPETAFRVQQASAETIAAIRHALRHSIGVRAWAEKRFRKS